MLSTREIGEPRVGEASRRKKVFIKGQMHASSNMTGTREFIVCRDNGTCCRGGEPKVADLIHANIKEPLTLEYQTGLRHVAKGGR